MNETIVRCDNCSTNNRIPALKQHLRPKCGKCGGLLDLNGLRLPAVELADATFHHFVGDAPLPVLVDFYSPTCGPCRSMMPVVDGLADRYRGRAIVAKLNTMANPNIAAQFAIRGVPSFLFFRQGQLLDQIAGAVPEQLLRQKLDTLL